MATTTTVTKVSPTKATKVAKTKVTPTVEPVVTTPEPEVQRNDTLRNVFFGLLSILVIIAIIFFAIQIRNQTVAQANAPEAPVGNNPPVVNNPPAAGNPSSSDTVSESTILVLGPLGSYHAVLDSNVGKWTLGIWPEAQVSVGEMTLSDLKIKGSTIQFVMPNDGTINNSAGTVSVNEQAWTLGNPITDPSGNTLVKKGDLVTISYGSNNDSAGFQLWFK